MEGDRCDDCGAELVREATPGGPALLGITLHTPAGTFCPRCCGRPPGVPATPEPQRGRR